MSRACARLRPPDRSCNMVRRCSLRYDWLRQGRNAAGKCQGDYSFVAKACASETCHGDTPLGLFNSMIHIFTSLFPCVARVCKHERQAIDQLVNCLAPMPVIVANTNGASCNCNHAPTPSSTKYTAKSAMSLPLPGAIGDDRRRTKYSEK